MLGGFGQGVAGRPGSYHHDDDNRRGRRERHHVVCQPSRQRRRPAALCCAPPWRRMAILSASDTVYRRWREYLSCHRPSRCRRRVPQRRRKARPLPVSGRPGRLRRAIQWVAANRKELGVSHLIVSGESGGGNLTLAVAHKAKRDGWLPEIAGIYAQCPFISNRWLEQPDELPSLKENEDYFFSRLGLALIGSIYDPDKIHAHDAACWPLEATEEELARLSAPRDFGQRARSTT